jgi:iron complex transport system substrate-binding protein
MVNVALATLLLTACSQSADPEADATLGTTQTQANSTETPIVISQDSVPFPVPATEPWPADSAQRIVALATGSGEIVAALGGADRVVGRDETSNAPDIAQTPVVTRGHSVSAEQVIALKPDLVLIDEATSPSEAIDQLRATGINVADIPEAWTLAEVAAKTQAIGSAIGAPESSIRYVQELATGSELALGDQAIDTRVAFLYLRGTSAVYLLGGVGSGADSLITESGAVDVGAESGLTAFTPLTAEALVNLNPNTILVMTKGLESVGGADGLFGLPGVAQTDAAEGQRVVAVDDTLLLSFGPRTSELVKALNSAWQRLDQ